MPKLMEINPRPGIHLWYRTELGINSPVKAAGTIRRSLDVARGAKAHEDVLSAVEKAEKLAPIVRDANKQFRRLSKDKETSERSLNQFGIIHHHALLSC